MATKKITLVMEVRELIRSLNGKEFTLVDIAKSHNKHHRNTRSALLREMRKRGEIEVTRDYITPTGGFGNVYKELKLMPVGFRPERKQAEKYERRVEMKVEREHDARMDNWKSIMPEFFLPLVLDGKKKSAKVYKGA